MGGSHDFDIRLFLCFFFSANLSSRPGTLGRAASSERFSQEAMEWVGAGRGAAGAGRRRGAGEGLATDVLYFLKVQ